MTLASDPRVRRLPPTAVVATLLCSLASNALPSNALAQAPAASSPGVPPRTPSSGASAAPASTADELDPETRVLAREFAIRGAEAFDAGDYVVALENFNRATAILDVPSIAVMQARTLVKLGRWLEGLDRFQQTARLELPARAPQPYRDAVGQAALEAEALRTQIPQVALLLSSSDAATPADIQVQFDEKTVPSTLLNILRPVDPGEHHVRASVDGETFFERTLEVAPLQQIQVLIPAPPSRSKAGGAVSWEKPILTDDAARRETPASHRWPVYGALGAAGLGLIGATVTGIAASQHKATLEAACDPQTKVCPREYRDDIDALDANRTWFYLFSGLTVIGGGVATYLWLSETPQSSVAIRLSPNSATLQARY